MSIEGMYLTILKTQVVDLKSLISDYDQNLGDVDLLLRNGHKEQAIAEIAQFSEKLTAIEKTLHEKYGN